MISSKQNQNIKLAKSLSSKKSRKETGLFLIEGPTLLEEALKKNIELKQVWHLEDYEPKQIEGSKCEIISQDFLEYISDTQNPNQVAAIAKQKPNADIDLTSSKFLLYCENIQDPGNLGSIIRSAVAAGVDAIILSEHCADIYNPKVIRASMGALFYAPIVYKNLSELDLPHAKIASSLQANQDHNELKLKQDQSILLMVGNESQGLEAETEKLADHLVKIKMANDFESLNVVAATSVLLFHNWRQD